MSSITPVQYAAVSFNDSKDPSTDPTCRTVLAPLSEASERFNFHTFFAYVVDDHAWIKHIVSPLFFTMGATLQVYSGTRLADPFKMCCTFFLLWAIIMSIGLLYAAFVFMVERNKVLAKFLHQIADIFQLEQSLMINAGPLNDPEADHMAVFGSPQKERTIDLRQGNNRQIAFRYLLRRFRTRFCAIGVTTNHGTFAYTNQQLGEMTSVVEAIRRMYRHKMRLIFFVDEIQLKDLS
ncbi:hypothetical protein VKT23_018644 [Stygiomarasmius scandens]|uniref:Uncharacterized protein n=1 Tax=Marasmiellus scandens TaxID=2682957 RepID=A0ABR1INP9_9AGAR